MSTSLPLTTVLCPLCDQPVDHHSWATDLSFMVNVICKRCGRFSISEEAQDFLNRKKEGRHLLSYVCRTWEEEGIPKILTTTMPLFLRKAPRLSVTEQLDRLLQEVAKTSNELGSRSTFNVNNDYPLVVAKSPEEALFLLNSLQERGDVTNNGTTSAKVSVAGWQRLEEARKSGRESRFAFVAMWFDKSQDKIYDEAIVPAIKEAGYQALRIDRTEHVNRIDDQIIADLRQSRFIVADFTGHRHGVYFETGFMLGLGRNIFWMCHKSALEGIHFDNRQYNFIDYDSPEDAKTRLLRRILAIEGMGPGQPAVR